MKNKKVKKNLIDFMDYLLKEDNNIPQPNSSYETRPVEQTKPVSLDQVVDRYIVRYEKEAIPTTNSYENQMFENRIPSYGDVLLEALNEADEEDPMASLDEDPAAPAPDAPVGDFGTDLKDTTDIGGGGTKKSDKEEKNVIINTPQINLQDFAKNVARMVNNFDTLLNPKDIILNRVENYILNNYDQRTADEFMNILDTNYSLRTMDKRDSNDSNTPTPYAAGALGSEG
jgi:hypothetical protein